MPSSSTESPSNESRTVWPLVFAGLHSLCFIAGFFIAIPIALSKVRFMFFTSRQQSCGKATGAVRVWTSYPPRGAMSPLPMLLLTSQHRHPSCMLKPVQLETYYQGTPPDMLKLVQLGPHSRGKPLYSTCIDTSCLVRRYLHLCWTSVSASVRSNSASVDFSFFFL